MAGDRELPPLRVKLIGDIASYRNMMRKADQLARKFEKVLLGIDVKVLATGIKNAATEMRRLASIGLNTQVRQTRALARNLESAAKSLKYINAGLKGAGGGNLGLGSGAWALAGASLGRSAAQAIMAVAPALTAAVKAAGVVAAGVVSQSGQTVRALMKNMSAAVQTGIKAATPAFANMFKAVANVVGKGIQAAGRIVSTSINQAGRVAATAITNAARIFASITGVMNTAMRTFGGAFNTLTRGMAGTLQAAIRSAGTVLNTGVRSVGQIVNSMIRNGARGGGGGAGGRGNAYGSFGGLGERADIYMHANAIRTLTQTTQSFVAASANWERMQVMMTGFTGSSTEAARVMEDMRLAALESPYDMQTLMDATKQMMGYGASADTAVEVTKMLGDVAGGSNDKMSRLALGMAQITSMGKLQGNELRQLTEHGFNPLRVISEETGIAYATLNKAKEEGLITDKMVVAALKVVTSEGGRFANMSYRMSNDVWGLAQRIKELATQLQRRFMDTLISETKAALRIVIDFVTALDKWAAAAENQQMVQSLARMARDAMVAAVAFHVLAGGIAVARWGMRQFISVFMLFSKSIGVVTASVRGLFALLTGAGLASNPVGWILGAVAALTAAVVALDVGLSREGGFAQFFKDMDEFGKRAFTFMQGFMANLGENMDILFKYLKDNWNQVLLAMGKAWLRITMSVIDFIVIQMPRELGPMFVDIGWSLYANLTNAYRRAIKFYVLTWDAMVNKNPVALGELASMATDLATAIAPGAKEARDKFRADRRTQAQKGLLDTIGTILSDEFGNLPNIPFNLKTPPVPGEPEMPAAPAKPDIDWGSMFNESIGKQGSKAVRPVAAGAAPIYRSAEYAVRVQAARDAMQARRRGDANMEIDVEKRMLQELKKISKNTGAKPAPVQINSANFLGQEVA